MFNPEVVSKNSHESLELSREEIREKMNDPTYLPTREQIISAYDTSIEDTVAWGNYFFNNERPVYELLTEEYVDALADFFLQKLSEYGNSTENPLTILEVGSGDGRLSHFLQKKLDEKAPGEVIVIASDSGQWNLETTFPVEKMEHTQALESRNPDIVVSSWMPYQTDLTADFRSNQSLKGYVLIGAPDVTGDFDKTWGNAEFCNSPGVEKDEDYVPEYQSDSFIATELEGLSQMQICRLDTHLSDEENSWASHHSITAYFERQTS